MSDKRVVIGIAYSQGTDLGAMLREELEEKGLGDIECVLAHTKPAVETFLSRDPSIIAVVLLRDMSVSSPYTAREIVMLAESYPDVVFVPICIETYKGSGFARELLDGSVFNMLFNCDSTLQNIAGRIARPYGRRDARRYYGLIGESEKTGGINPADTTGLSDENYYSYLEYLQEDSADFDKKLHYIKGLLDSATFSTLLLRLPNDLKDQVMQIPGYEEFYLSKESKPVVKKREGKVREREQKEPVKKSTDKESVGKKTGEKLISFLGLLGDSIASFVKSDETENVTGVRKLILRAKKEFDALELALADELSSAGGNSVYVASEAAEPVRVIVTEQKDLVVPEGFLETEAEKDGAVELNEDSVVIAPEPEVIVQDPVSPEVITLSEVSEEPVVSVGDVATGECLEKEEPETQKKNEKASSKKEKPQKVIQEKVKSVYIGSVVVAVASIKKGIGCSHVARILANYMSQIGKRKTCFIDCEKPLYAAQDGLSNGVDVLSFSELAMAYNRYDCIVMDVGTDYKRFQQEIVRANIKVMCCVADDVALENLYKFMQKDAEPHAWMYAFNHVVTRQKVKRVEELMEDYKYLFIPACSEEELPKAFVKDLRRLINRKIGR